MLALNSGHTVREVCHPKLIGAPCHELTVYPVTCCNLFPADCRTHFFTPEHAAQAYVFHQTRDGASGHAEALTSQLAPDLTNAIDTVVFVVRALVLLLKQIIAQATLTTFFRMLTVVLVPVVCRRGDIQLMAYWYGSLP